LLIIGASALVAVLLVAVTLLLTADGPDSGRAQFGRPLLVGAIVGLAFVPVQVATQNELRRDSERREHENAEAAERRDLLMQISLRNKLPGIDLRDRDLRGVYLFNKDLAGANLSGADLRRANLAYADLRSADLTGARFDRANMYSAQLEGATLSRTSFRGANLRSARFGRHGWRGGKDSGFFYTTLASAYARLPVTADFTDADLLQAAFERADLTKADFTSASLVGTRFDSVILEAARFDEIEGPMLADHVDFCRASFSSAKLEHSVLSDVNLRTADFSGADLKGMSLWDADARNADFGEGPATPPPTAEDGDVEVGPNSDVKVTADAPEIPDEVVRALDLTVTPAPQIADDRCMWLVDDDLLRPLALDLPTPKLP